VDLGVWVVELDQPESVVADLAAHLDDFERRTAADRRAGAPRDRYVVAHGALREILGALTGDVAALPIVRRCVHCGDLAHGKPAVLEPAGLDFSLSHSGATGVVAVARDHAVGVDVEVMRARPYLERLAARILSPAEHAEWLEVDPVDRTRGLLRVWTAKEAYLKALGLGLTRPLRTVPARPDGWTIAAMDLGSEVVASVAVAGTHQVPGVAAWVRGAGVSLGDRW
jgi:4'-phosphopantetheinyl transferase